MVCILRFAMLHYATLCYTTLCCEVLCFAVRGKDTALPCCSDAHLLLLLLEDALEVKSAEGVGTSLVLRRGRVGSVRPEVPAVARGPALVGLLTSPLPILLFFISRASSFFNLQPTSFVRECLSLWSRFCPTQLHAQDSVCPNENWKQHAFSSQQALSSWET